MKTDKKDYASFIKAGSSIAGSPTLQILHKE
jgi:hypothetical protein